MKGGIQLAHIGRPSEWKQSHAQGENHTRATNVSIQITDQAFFARSLKGRSTRR